MDGWIGGWVRQRETEKGGDKRKKNVVLRKFS